MTTAAALLAFAAYPAVLAEAATAALLAPAALPPVLADAGAAALLASAALLPVLADAGAAAMTAVGHDEMKSRTKLQARGKHELLVFFHGGVEIGCSAGGTTHTSD